jgi:BNR repeat-like domain
MTPIKSIALGLIYPSLPFVIALILLLSDLPVLYASNSNLDTIFQNKLEFEDSVNLTNNERDSVYGQISTSNNNIHVVWQESVPGSNTRNYDILFKYSTDNGKRFSQEINLSNNMGFSEHPQISSIADNVHVIWADNTNGNKQVYFKTSNDNGNTFGETINLSDNSSISFNQDVAAFGNNVYAIWVEKTISGPYQVMLAVSEDGGKNFKDSISLSENADEYSYPRISALNGNVYVTWNAGDLPNANTGIDEGVFFISSSNNGLTFGDISKLNVEENGFGKPQVTVGYDNTVYVIWGGSTDNQVDSIYLVKSGDSGRSFGEMKKIEETEQGNISSPLNVEIAVDETNRLFVAWQDKVEATATTLENEDIMSAVSLDGGESFESTTNISNNGDTSECPSIAMNGDNIYITWEDLTPGNHEVLYRQGVLSI